MLKWLFRKYKILPDNSTMFGSLIEIRRGKYKGVIARIPRVFIKDGFFNFSFEVVSNPKNYDHVKLKEYFAEHIVRDIMTSKKTSIRLNNGAQ